MSDTVEFKDGNFRGGEPPQFLEDAIRKAASYAGVHRFDFRNTINETFANLDDWTSDAGGTFVISSNRLSATGGGGGVWYATRHATEVHPGFVASFDVVSGSGGFAFRMDENALPEPYYVAWWTSSSVGISRIAADRSETVLTSIPATPFPGRYQVYVRYSLDSVDDDRKWLEIGVWVDGRCVAGYAEDIGGTAYDWDGDYVGFAVEDGDNLIVDNFTIAELTRAVEWITVDVGQDPGSGMSQAIGTSRVTYACRFDNTLRVWRIGNRSADWTLASGYDRPLRLDARKDIGRATHVRVQAAIHEADGFDDVEGEARMHRFILHNDPNIMTGQEAYVEAHRVLHDEKELSGAVRFGLPPNYLLEQGDRITVNSVDYRIRAMSVSIEMSGEGPQISQVLECQRYYAFTEPAV